MHNRDYTLKLYADKTYESSCDEIAIDHSPTGFGGFDIHDKSSGTWKLQGSELILSATNKIFQPVYIFDPGNQERTLAGSKLVPTFKKFCGRAGEEALTFTANLH